MTDIIEFDDFLKVDMRVGRVVKVEDFPKARKPAWKLWIDFGGDIGVKKSSAQVTDYYAKEDMQGRLVVCVVNFKPRQVADFMSEVLTLGFYDAENKVRLLEVHESADIGSRIA